MSPPPTKPLPFVRILPNDANGNLAAMYLVWYGKEEGQQRQADVAKHGVVRALELAEARKKIAAKV